MEFNKLVFAGLSVGCLVAAAGGSYLAVRQNQAAIAAPASIEAPVAPGAPVAPAGVPAGAVTESEGVITPEAAKPAAPARREPVVSSSTASRPSRADARPAPARTPRVSSPPVERPAAPESTREASPVARSGQTTESPAVASSPSTSGSMWETRPSVQPSVPDYKEPEPPPPPPPPAPEFVDLTVPSDAVLGLQIERTVSSELARVEDKVDARVTRDVRVSDRIAIPAGSTVRGSVTEVERGGRMKGKARLAIRFHTIVLADGTQLPLKTEPVVREGQSPGGESAAKVGGAAIGGAILGAILGGGKGAAIGGAVGAGAGTAAAMTNDRNPATLPAGTTVTVRMQAPVTVTVQKE
jgi:type IV secretory pathway VirB10-like protein